jgi:hypothetical protein
MGHLTCCDTIGAIFNEDEAMKSRRWIVQHRMVFSLCLVILAVAFVSPAAEAQAYVFGRTDFPTTGTPTNVILADFNGDGRPDLAVSDSQNSWVSILLNVANGGFVSNGNYGTGSTPTSLVAADFNGDKKLDLAVVNANAGTVSILLGKGDGTFQGRVDYPVGLSPSGIVAADFNGDGKVDLATISTNDSAIAILLGKGNGSFEVQALIPVISGPAVLAGADVNGDGKIDLIMASANYSNPTIAVLLSKGDGTFLEVDSQGSNYASALAVGDFNHDGKLDVVEASYGLYLALGNGDGSFQTAVAIPNAPYVSGSGLLAGDFNHDHKLDIAAPGVWVLPGNGDGTFQNAILSPAGGTPMAIGDINGDGEPDLAAITYPSGVAILLGNGASGFTDLQTISVASAPNYYSQVGVAGDFNGDGKLDMAVAQGSYPNGQVSVELSNGNGTFQAPIISSLSTTATSPTSMLAGDFNGDGKSDLVVEDDNGNGFQVLMGRGDGSFEAPVDTPVSNSMFSWAVGDFNGDGKADLAVTTNNGPSINIYLGKGDGTFSLRAQYVVYPNSYVSVADVKRDGKLDLVVVGSNYYGGSSLLIFPGNGDGSFRNPIFGPSNVYTSPAVIADFNHDGKLDVAVATSASGSNGIAFLAGRGDGTFAAPVYSNTGFQFVGLLMGSDFSGDHKIDLVAHSSSYSSETMLMSGNGDGTFRSPVSYDSISNGYAVSFIVGDFNSDGVSDLGMPGQNPVANTPSVFLYLSQPAPSLLPTALNFGSETVGKTSSPKMVTVTNEGNARLRIFNIGVSGDFLEENNCGKYLALGSSCTIQVSFKPQAKGIRTGTVRIADSAPGHMQRVSLKGNGK